LLFVTGDTATLDLEVYVNDKTASTLNSGEDKLEDILVLHLEGGKDFFLTVLGSYTFSCFGCSLEALTHLPTPIRDTPPDKIHQLVCI
jgi:phosphatidylinositol-bisphosphatase